MSRTAEIHAVRDDRKAEYENFDAVEAAIQNPHGDFPTEAFHAAQEFVSELSPALRDGQRKLVGEVVYCDDSDEFEIREV